MKSVAVIGLGKSGMSAAHFLQKQGYSVFVTDDKKPCDMQGMTFLPPDQMAASVAEYEFVVISPGVALTHAVAVAAHALGKEVFCDVELAFRHIAAKPVSLIGITGSNGKTTTTTLANHLLNSCKKPAKAVGNIGNPILSELVLSEIEAPAPTLVVELSSFQLETMATAVLDAACILNITPNHLDRHGTMEEYTRIKQRIGTCVKPTGQLWARKGCGGSIRPYYFGFDPSCDLYSDGVHVHRFGKNECMLPELLQYSRSHNVENYLAAYALARSLGADPQECMKAYATFIKPKHRLEYVRTLNGIMFYDDSKATSVDAVLRAVESIQSPIVLIAGGVHKGYPYTDWQKAFRNKVKACVLIGQAADSIEQDLQKCVPVFRAQSLDDAVIKAVQQACSGDAVLLSPGCASYDMFASFEERGKKFQEIVCSIA